MFEDSLSPMPRSPEDQTVAQLLAALPGFPSRGGTPLPRPVGTSPSGLVNLNGGGNSNDLLEELRKAKTEIELLKSMDPFKAADMAIELQLAKMRAAEAMSARDSAVQRLSSAYDSIKEKAQIIGRLQCEKADLEHRLASAETRIAEAVSQAKVEERRTLETEMVKLREITLSFKDSEKDSCELTSPSPTVAASITPLFDGMSPSPLECNNIPDKMFESLTNEIDGLSINSKSQFTSEFQAQNEMDNNNLLFFKSTDDLTQHQPFHTCDPIEMNRIRNSVLVALPIPPGIPDEEMKPIMIPAPFTIHEFLGNTTGSLRNSLSGYRTFHDKTTRWCPDREEHGYFLTPLYRCTTKPRVATAHSWNEADPRGRMTKPTECFYNREGKWYYAGQYVAVRLPDLSTKEWEELDSEATTLLVKDTVSGRKNTTPTVHYEVSQLYAVGALKVACVGLQCVGFNSSLYHTIMEQAEKCRQSGRWKVGWGSTTEFSSTETTDSSSSSVTNTTGAAAGVANLSLVNYM